MNVNKFKYISAGVLLGWILNIASIEYQDFEHFSLAHEALSKGLKWNYIEGKSVNTYIDENDTEILKYINYRPNIWTCVFLYSQARCPVDILKKERYERKR